MLLIENLRKRFGSRTVLHDLSLSVRPGEIAGLIGHNGAGKSTLVGLVTGLLRPDGGRIDTGGAQPALAPQEIALYPTATPREHLRLFGGLAGLRRRALEERADALLAELALGECADRRAAVLSGGQQRRVQAGCALIALTGPGGLLLMDEPTAGADPSTRALLLAAVRRRAEQDGAAVLYTTHYLPELDELGATIAVLRAGRLVARGSRAELLEGLPGELRLRFADDAPDAPPHRYPSRDPGGRLPGLLAELAGEGRAPVSVEVLKPQLDDLYRALELTEGVPA
ncbi:ABC transporter [Mangrovactinospora gilvigrisea]|uniref:ABC transporter n=1 Tax=Mangrovactinospora gilvigrisea TaxID=1428644 RepID=A0A1J7C9B7_9ACTN|nr:ABC transporter ATP-binding protein [Mangrovactinospora gilvigrisea]OIV38128.1 ABC transporter [Mangrovactinospora gilvigrisea]